MRWLLLALTVFTSGCIGFAGDMMEPLETTDAPGGDAGESTPGAPADGGVPTPDAGAEDAGPPVNAGDAGMAFDAGTSVADAGAPFDAGVMSPDAGTPGMADAGTRAPVEVLIAQGRFGRTTMSCDDGRTWRFERDEANGATCNDMNVDCFHNQWSSMGTVHTGTAVVATWGWGAVPGRVRRTTDGVNWTDVVAPSIFGAIAASDDGVVLAASNPPRISQQDGLASSWTSGGDLQAGNVTRHAAWADGRFFIVLDDRIKASDDRGATWTTLNVPSLCLGALLGVLTHDTTVVLVRYDGRVCTSVDKGATWTNRQLDSTFSTRGVYGAGAFHVWNGATRWRSVDGLTWSSTPGTPSDVQVGAVVVTRAGTFVAFKGGWRSDYQDERVYRSADGVTWQTIPAANHGHSHAITHLVTGPLDAAGVCP